MLVLTLGIQLTSEHHQSFAKSFHVDGEQVYVTIVCTAQLPTQHEQDMQRNSPGSIVISKIT